MAKKTALIEVHRELEAKTAPVNGWDLPLYYPGGAGGEVRACRSGAGIFDGGYRSLRRIADVLPADLAAIPVGEFHELPGMAACRMADADVLTLVDAGAVPPDGQSLDEILTSMTVLGPQAEAVLRTAAGDDAELPAPGHWNKTVFRDGEDEFSAIVLNRPRFGEPGCELIFNAEYAAELYGVFYRDVRVKPAGWNAWEQLRSGAEA